MNFYEQSWEQDEVKDVHKRVLSAVKALVRLSSETDLKSLDKELNALIKKLKSRELQRRIIFEKDSNKLEEDIKPFQEITLKHVPQIAKEIFSLDSGKEAVDAGGHIARTETTHPIKKKKNTPARRKMTSAYVPFLYP